jgi:hypothetical protein
LFLIGQKQELPVAATFVNESGQMCNVYRGSSIDASYQVSVHLAKRFQKRRFLKIGQSETRIAWYLWKILYKHCTFVLIRLQMWPPQAILVSD